MEGAVLTGRRGREWLTARRRKRIGSGALTTLTWALLALMLAPVVWMVIAALQPSSALVTGEVDVFNPTFDAFSRMWERVDFERYLANSIVICVGAAGLATAVASAAGYALARFPFRGSRSFGIAVIATQLIPGTMFLLPIYLGFVWMNQHTPIGLFDTHVGMILVYTAFFAPVSIYLMRAYFQAVPRELEDAAMVDGCTPMGAFVKVVLPNAIPGLLATFVYAFLFAWDELLFVTALTESNAETIPLGIRNFIGNYNQDYAALMAAGVITTVPVMIAFYATQRWLVRGITAGAVRA
jgi:multiple sugar transport system permease protein